MLSKLAADTSHIDDEGDRQSQMSLPPGRGWRDLYGKDGLVSVARSLDL